MVPDLTENSYIAVKKTQVRYYKAPPLYIKTEEGSFVLYKSENEQIDINRFTDERYPQLYIHKENREIAVQELQHQLKLQLKASIKSGKLNTIKSGLIEIVQEALEDPLETGLQTLPETIDIMYDECSKTTKILKKLKDIQFGGYSLVEHSVNVMVFTLSYSLFCGFDEEFTKRLSLGALIHDIGLTQVPREIVVSDQKLTEKEFNIYKTHPAIGHDIIKNCQNLDPSIATGVLEHHERLDGKGYPREIANLSFEGRAIGLIDSFDSLVSSERDHRKIKKPFDAMSLIKSEVLKEGRFDRNIFKDLCLSLAGKAGLG